MGFEVRISFFDPIDIKVKSAFSGGGGQPWHSVMGQKKTLNPHRIIIVIIISTKADRQAGLFQSMWIILTYFIRRSITVQPTFCYPCLDSAALHMFN